MRRLLQLILVIVLAGCFHHASAQRALAPMNPRVTLTSTNLPIVWINVDSVVNRDERVTARMKIIDNGAGHTNYADTISHPGQRVDYEGYIGLRYRGNSSYLYSAKKPYSFRPLNRPLEEGGTWKRVSILGMPKDNNWAMLAPYNDKSMIRDILAFEISRPWMEYTPQGRFCEVICNDVYYGVFLLCEVVSKGANRLNLENPGESGDELTGGYLMEVDRNEGNCYRSWYLPVRSDGSVISTTYIYFQYKYPEYEDLTSAQMAYIQDRIYEMERTFANYTFRDSQSGECLYIDEMSFIDYQLAMEISHNVDAYRLSCKFFKHRDSVDPRFKLVVWDMNLAYGNANYNEGYRTDTWAYQMNNILPERLSTDMVPFWWYKLNKEAKYKQHLKERWVEYRRSNLRIDSLMAKIDSLATLLTVGGAEERNSRAYPVWGIYVWPNYYIARDFESEIAFLKRWLIDRIMWMDEHLDYVPELQSGDVNGDGELGINDVNALINVIGGGSSDEGERSRADVNEDGEINVNDVNALIDLIAGF